MTAEQKNLLLKDLCARLPYGVMCRYQHIQYIENGKIIDINMFGRVNIDGHIKDVCDIKPYLFHLSSMTDEQLYEVSQILGKDVAIFTDYLLTIDHRRRTFSYQELDALFNWFDKNYFDYRGLIPMGLAIDATNLNIY